MIEKIVKKAKEESKTVYVYAHQYPDGDAISSACAVVEYLKNQGIDAEYVVTKEVRLYNQIVGIISPTTSVRKDEISLILDTSSVRTAENKLFRHSRKEDIYVIDHHVKLENARCIEDELGVPLENVLRDSSASSTCEILTNELEKEQITPEIANMLTLGLLTDTGKLKFLKQNTLQNLSKLIKAGANYESISSICNKKRSLRDEVGMATLLLEAEQFQIGDTFGIILPVSNKNVSDLNMNYGTRNAQKKIFKMESIEECSFYCMIAENMAGKYDLEFRSTKSYGNFDVSKLAIMYGGGGHYAASGCALYEEDGWNQESIMTEIKQQAVQMYARQGASLPPIRLNEQDNKLSEILDKTKRLTEKVTLGTLQEVDELIQQGANYEYVFKKFRTFERFMLENEVLSRVPKDKLFDRKPNVNISISPQDMEMLQQKYGANENDILDVINIFSNMYINSASIKLPSGKRALIDKKGNTKIIEKEETTR